MHNTGQNANGTTGTDDKDIDALEAWDITFGADRVVVAVIDSGVDGSHPDLSANLWTNSGEIPGNGLDDDGNGYVDDIRGWDFANKDNNPADDNGHGTHVTGIIAAVGNNGIGVAGVAWNAKIMALKSFRADGSGLTSDAILAIAYANLMGADVINNSWGGAPYSQALFDMIRSSSAMVVFAAGNSGQNNDLIPHYPSSYTSANILAVAATDPNDNLALFSNFGVTQEPPWPYPLPLAWQRSSRRNPTLLPYQIIHPTPLLPALVYPIWKLSQKSRKPWTLLTV